MFLFFYFFSIQIFLLSQCENIELSEVFFKNVESHLQENENENDYFPRFPTEPFVTDKAMFYIKTLKNCEVSCQQIFYTKFDDLGTEHTLTIPPFQKLCSFFGPISLHIKSKLFLSVQNDDTSSLCHLHIIDETTYLTSQPEEFPILLSHYGISWNDKMVLHVQNKAGTSQNVVFAHPDGTFSDPNNNHGDANYNDFDWVEFPFLRPDFTISRYNHNDPLDLRVDKNTDEFVILAKRKSSTNKFSIFRVKEIDGKMEFDEIFMNQGFAFPSEQEHNLQTGTYFLYPFHREPLADRTNLIRYSNHPEEYLVSSVLAGVVIDVKHVYPHGEVSFTLLDSENNGIFCYNSTHVCSGITFEGQNSEHFVFEPLRYDQQKHVPIPPASPRDRYVHFKTIIPSHSIPLERNVAIAGLNIQRVEIDVIEFNANNSCYNDGFPVGVSDYSLVVDECLKTGEKLCTPLLFNAGDVLGRTPIFKDFEFLDIRATRALVEIQGSGKWMIMMLDTDSVNHLFVFDWNRKDGCMPACNEMGTKMCQKRRCICYDNDTMGHWKNKGDDIMDKDRRCSECKTFYSGPKCLDYCDPDITCKGYGDCKEGKCVCNKVMFPHMDATDCGKCEFGWDYEKECMECETGREMSSDCRNCSENYLQQEDGSCKILSCGKYAFSDGRTCSGYGDCMLDDSLKGGKCVCNFGYLGLFCEIWPCFGVMRNDTENVCSGKGECSKLNTCVCEEGFVGTICEELEGGIFSYWIVLIFLIGCIVPLCIISVILLTYCAYLRKTNKKFFLVNWIRGGDDRIPSDTIQVQDRDGLGPFVPLDDDLEMDFADGQGEVFETENIGSEDLEVHLPAPPRRDEASRTMVDFEGNQLGLGMGGGGSINNDEDNVYIQPKEHRVSLLDSYDDRDFS